MRHVLLCGEITEQMIRSFVSEFYLREQAFTDWNCVIMHHEPPAVGVQKVVHFDDAQFFGSFFVDACLP